MNISFKSLVDSAEECNNGLRSYCWLRRAYIDCYYFNYYFPLHYFINIYSSPPSPPPSYAFSFPFSSYFLLSTSCPLHSNFLPLLHNLTFNLLLLLLLLVSTATGYGLEFESRYG
jgi:hypothetical protein